MAEDRAIYRRTRTDVPRRRWVQVRLSDEEHALLSAAAERRRLALGAFVAQAAMTEARGVTTPGVAAVRDLLMELNQAWTAVSRIGTNLNQVATVANTTGEVDSRLGRMLDYLRRVLARLETAAFDVQRRLP